MWCHGLDPGGELGTGKRQILHQTQIFSLKAQSYGHSSWDTVLRECEKPGTVRRERWEGSRAQPCRVVRITKGDNVCNAAAITGTEIGTQPKFLCFHPLSPFWRFQVFHTQWMWVWINSGSWQRTGRPGMLQYMGSQRIVHVWATELNW